MAFMSGRALFNYNPDLFEDDENAVDDDGFEDEEEKAAQQESEDEGPLYGNDNEESKEESKEAVREDANLFAG